MKFNKIKIFPNISYRADVPWHYLKENLNRLQNREKDISPLDLNPDFQRGYIWNEEQKIKYIEFILRNGCGGRELFFNCPGWMRDFKGPFVIVDGKQRLNAALSFLNDEIPAFGYKYSSYEDRLPFYASFSFNIATLKTRKEVLQWYIDFNSGGTVHSEQELLKVTELIDLEKE